MASATQASARPTVAIAGATGELGKHITNTLLQPDILSTFSGLVLLSRQKPEGNPQLEEWARGEVPRSWSTMKHNFVIV
jgi:hypothetical protein